MHGREFCLRNLSDVGVVKLLPDGDLLLEGLAVFRRCVLSITPPVQNLHCIPNTMQCVRNTYNVKDKISNDFTPSVSFFQKSFF